MIIFAAILFLTFRVALAEPYSHKKTSLTFPDQAGNLKLIKVTEYEPLYAGLGTGISYRSDTNRADVFLYDLQKGPVPDGVSSQAVIDEFSNAVTDIYSMEKQGTYKNIATVVRKETVNVSNVKFLHSVLTYEQNNVKRISHIYLTGYGGFFMKLRVTYPGSAKASEEPNLAAFLLMVGNAVKTASR